ncbi:hypothetical protein ACFOMH_16035 [Paracoccus mangrovi]|uniref:Uncharacterized protein n=2 Tax=Paracoccus TaxID=265 RepID=A0ABV7R6S2_9RHOB
MKITDKLDYAHQPEIALPLDLGDGPFLSAPASGDAASARMAEVDSVFRRDKPFRETMMTDMPILGKSDMISIGYFRVSDKVGPNSFRRVFQSFRNEQSATLSGPVVIVFRGGGTAIIEEGLSAVAPTPQKIEVPKPAYPTRRNARGKSSASPGHGKSLEDAMGTLEQLQAWATPTLPAQSSFFYVNFRFPAYEPAASGAALTPGDVMCFNPLSGGQGSIMDANQSDEFDMGNSARDAQAYRFTYPLGRSVPVIFDIINRNPTHSVVVDMNVSVLIDRRETKRD